MKKWHIFYSTSELWISRNRLLAVFRDKIWELVPPETKQSWIPSQYPDRLCQICLPGVGFIWKYTTIIRLFLDLILHFFCLCFCTLIGVDISPVNHYKVLVFNCFYLQYFIVYFLSTINNSEINKINNVVFVASGPLHF